MSKFFYIWATPISDAFQNSMYSFPRELETERLLLRRWRKSDRHPFASMNANAQVMKYFPTKLTTQQSDALVDRIQKHFDNHGYGLWAVEVKKETSFAGFVGLAVPTFEAHFTPCVEIGWRLNETHWGNGYATEGALAVLDFAFDSLQLDEVVSMTTVGNMRSRRVMERIGMTNSPTDDFNHPSIPENHPLKRHVLYRVKRTRQEPA